jgi:hypothetical protein
MVIDKLETAVELFERRSGIYSDRTTIPMFDLMKLSEYLFAFKPYCAPFAVLSALN